jgi:hypothetical protein
MECRAAGPRIQYSLQLGWMSGFIEFFVASGRSVFQHKDVGVNRCLLGSRQQFPSLASRYFWG